MIDVTHVLAFHIMRKQNFFASMISDTSSIEPLSGMKWLNPRHQNVLPFCPESEYYHQNGNCYSQHSTKLIDVTHVSAFHIMRKQVFALTTSDTSFI